MTVLTRARVAIASTVAAAGAAAAIAVPALADRGTEPVQPKPSATQSEHGKVPVQPAKPKVVDLTPKAKTPVWAEDSGAVHRGQTSSTAPVVTRLDASQMYLRMTGAKLASRAAGIEKSGAVKVLSLGKLPLDRTYVAGTDRGAHAAIPNTKIRGQGAIHGFRWNHEDENTSGWMPQSVTTSVDANIKTGRIDGRKWVMVAWHNADNSAGRVSFVDYTKPNDPKSARYRNVELVMPVTRPKGSKLPPYEPIATHGSGLVVKGNTLYVGQGTKLRMFDLNRLWKDAKGNIVLPQVNEADGPSGAVLLHGNTPSFSGLSLDQVDAAHPALAFQEYSTEKGGRIGTVPLDPKTGAPLVSKDGRIHFTSAFAVPLARIAGIADLGNGWMQLGTMDHVLYRIRPGAKPQAVNALPKGSQQFSYDELDHKLWMLAEHEGNRPVAEFSPSKS